MKQSEIKFHKPFELKNIIYYKCRLSDDRILSFLKYINSNLSVLNTSLSETPIVSINQNQLTYDPKECEIIIPITSDSITENGFYSFRENFKIPEGISVRHFGNFKNIEYSIKELNTYLKNNNLKIDSNLFFIIKNTESSAEDTIIDIIVKTKKHIRK